MTSTPTPVQITSWQAAERNAATWMRHWGYPDATVTPPGPDGGIDVTATGALAQVKFTAAHVGAPALQRLVGARGHHHDHALLFFTGTGYAKPAVDYADMMRIALFRYAFDGTMTAVNPAAHAILDRARAAAVENFPLDEVRKWANTAATFNDAHQAVTAGWWRRHGSIVAAIVLAASAIEGAAETLGLTAPSSADGPAGWGAVAAVLVVALLCWAGWAAENREREQHTAKYPTLPRPGPLPEPARTVAQRIPGARPGADRSDERKAAKAYTKIIRGLSNRQARAIVAAARDGR